MNPKHFLFFLPLLFPACALGTLQGPGVAFEGGLQRTAIGVNQYSSTTESPNTGNNVDTSALAIDVTHGWFFSPNLEVGGKFGYSNRDVDNTPTTSQYTVDAFARWYFDNRSQLRTWAMLFAGLGNVDFGFTDDDFVEYGLGIGVSNMFSTTTSFDVGVDYRMQSFDQTNTDIDGIFLTAFFSIYYGQ